MEFLSTLLEHQPGHSTHLTEQYVIAFFFSQFPGTSQEIGHAICTSTLRIWIRYQNHVPYFSLQRMERKSPFHSKIQNWDPWWQAPQRDCPVPCCKQWSTGRVNWWLVLTVIHWPSGWKGKTAALDGSWYRAADRQTDRQQLWGLPREEQVNANSSSKVNGHK